MLVAITSCIALGLATMAAPPVGPVSTVIGMGTFVAVYLASPALLDRFGARRMASF